MKTFTDTISLTPYTSKAFDLYFGDKRFAVFDIETTGLSPAYCRLILSGFLLVDNGHGKVIQFFADQLDDEQAVLTETLKLLSQVDFVITYNGRHFDLPFVRARAKKHGIPWEIEPYDLDLYRVVSAHSPLRDMLPSLKQKSLEQFCGLSDGRDDGISGGESVALYERYLQTHTFDLERQILLHNHDDVIQLYRLLPVLAKCDLHRACFHLGFPAGDHAILRIQLQGREVHVTASQLGTPTDYISFPTDDRPYALRMDAASRLTELTIPCSVRSGAFYFDARAILGDRCDALESYPALVNGYLIAADKGRFNHMEVNTFLKAFFEDLFR